MRSMNFAGIGSVISSSPSSALICEGTSCQYRILYVVMLFALRRETQKQVDSGGSVRAVAIGADLVGEHLADGRAPDGHPDVAQAGRREAVDYRLHVHHGGGQQRAHPDDVRLAF